MAVLLPVVLLDLLLRRRFRALLFCGLGLAASALFLGVIDWLTWGQPFHSAIEYLRFHLVESGGEIHGVQPRFFYWTDGIIKMLGFGAVLVMLPMLFGLRRHAHMVAAWLIPVVLLSLLAHKEERFLLPIWPFLLCAALSGILSVTDRLGSTVARRARPSDTGRSRLSQRVAGTAMLLWITLAVVSAYVAVGNLPTRLSAGSFAAQHWIGEQTDVSGVLTDNVQYFDEPGHTWIDGDYRPRFHGGYMLLHKGVPLRLYTDSLIEHELYNYVVLGKRELQVALDRRRDFERVAFFEQAMVVYRRVPTGD